MAQRRMLSKQITETDMFMDMPLSSQALYLHLIMNADDDGFISNAKTILRMAGASNDDLKLLIAKQFILSFDDGITVVKDWRIHNYIRKDRYHRTIYDNHLSELNVRENGSYQRNSSDDSSGMTSGIPNVSRMDTEVRLGKGRLELGKVSVRKAISPKEENNTEDDPKINLNPSKKKNENDPYTFYQQNIGVMNPVTSDSITMWLDDFTKQGTPTRDEASQIINLAITKASDQGVRKWAYVNGILKDWSIHNLVTLANIKASDQERETKKNNKPRNGQPKRRQLWTNNSFSDDDLPF